MNLVAQLRALGSHVARTFPSMNGACCLYSAIVASELHRQGILCWGIVADWAGKLNGVNLDTVRETRAPRTVKDWTIAGFRFCHCLVQFEYDGRIWTHDHEFTVDTLELDSRNGWHLDPANHWPILDGRLTVAELNELANDVTAWNKKFNRREGIVVITHAAHEFLSPG